MKKFGLIGYPLSHSFSARYFSEKFIRENLNGFVYLNFAIRRIEELPEILQHERDLAGLNVTIPHKEQVLKYLNFLDPIVRETGACNCIRIDQVGKLYGYNTDVTGFEKSLCQQLLPIHKSALILGTGGAAKAVAFVLRKLGISFLYVTRNKNAGDMINYDQLSFSILQKHLLIINTTPVGMYPAKDEMPPIDYTVLTENHYLFDLIYNPEKTQFLLLGEKHGARIQNGKDMLEVQAEESWKIWNA